LHYQCHYLPIEPINKDWQNKIFAKEDSKYIHKKLGNKESVIPIIKEWDNITRQVNSSNNTNIYAWRKVSKKK